MKLKAFLVDFKNNELSNIDDLDLEQDIKLEYIDLLNEFFDREVEDRDIVLDDLDKDNGFIYKLMCEWFENEFVIKNDLGLVWYEYSLEDLFRDSFGIGVEYSYNLFELKDINSKLYKKQLIRVGLFIRPTLYYSVYLINLKNETYETEASIIKHVSHCYGV